MAENAGLDPEIVKEVLADSGVDPAAEAAKAKAAKKEATAAEGAAAAHLQCTQCGHYGRL